MVGRRREHPGREEGPGSRRGEVSERPEGGDKVSLPSVVVGRLANWKFKQALTFLPDDPAFAEQRAVIEALIRMFGNVPYIDGDMGIIVGAAVASLIGYTP